MLRKTVSQVLKVSSLVIFRSSGTDVSFLNTRGKDLRFIGTVRLLLNKNYLIKWLLSPSPCDNFLARFTNLKCLLLVFLALRLFSERKIKIKGGTSIGKTSGKKSHSAENTKGRTLWSPLYFCKHKSLV